MPNNIIINQLINSSKYINLKPTLSHRLNKKLAIKYLSLQPNDESRFFALLALKYTKYVNFNNFYNNLLNSVNLFNNLANTKSSLIIPADAIKKLSSELWTFLLAYDKFSDKIQEISTEISNNNIVLIDDALYSGMHMANNIYNIVSKTDTKFTFHIIAPYVTLNSMDYIRKTFYKHNIIFYYSYIMKPFKSLILKDFMDKFHLNKKDALKLINKVGESFLIEEQVNPVAIYFDHKIPDEFSSICSIYLGIVSNYKTNSEVKFFRPLINNFDIRPFYKDELKKIIDNPVI